MNKLIVISDGEAVGIRRRWERGALPVLEHEEGACEKMGEILRLFIEGRWQEIELPAMQQVKKRDLAERRRAWFEDWYHNLGLGGWYEKTDMSIVSLIPKPDVSNREFARRAQRGQGLFYRPATKDISYEAFMTAVGQGNHWTVTNEAERAKIIWEPTEIGYWFWAEVQERCPRLGTCWNDLSKVINLLSLEEYMVVWHAHKAEINKLLDHSTWTWLRTRYNLGGGRLGVLRADGYDGGVRVSGPDPEDLAVPSDHGGGRAAEVMKQAA